MSSNKNNNKRLKIADNLLTPKEQQQQSNSFISAGVEERYEFIADWIKINKGKNFCMQLMLFLGTKFYKTIWKYLLRPMKSWMDLMGKQLF